MGREQQSVQKKDVGQACQQRPTEANRAREAIHARANAATARKQTSSSRRASQPEKPRLDAVAAQLTRARKKSRKAPAAVQSSAGSRRSSVTNLDKVFFPKEKLTRRAM